MVRCCVKICKSDSTKHTVRFHSFPKNPDVFKKWIEKINLISSEDKITPYNYFKVCREHFKFSDYISDKHLKKGTVPSLNLEIPIFIKEHDYCLKGSIVSKAKECYSNESSDNNLQYSTLIDSNRQCFDSPKSIESIKTSAMNELCAEPNNICEKSGVKVGLDEGESLTEYNLVESLEEEFQDSLYSLISEHSVDNDINSNQNSSGQPLGAAGVIEKIFEPKQKTKPKRPYNAAARKQRYYASKVRSLKAKVKLTKKSNPAWDRSKMTRAQVDFIEMQIRNSSKHKNGRRYKLNEKSMLLGMFKKGPKSFRSFSKVLLIPTKQTLTQHASRTDAHFQPGINYNLMKFMKETVSKMTAKERMCCISWDEVALAPELNYCKSTDYIEGFVDVGEGSQKDFTNHALTFMVRGIAKPFKQSIAYFFTSPQIKGHELAELIILVIEAILKTGLVVVISVCDQIAINVTSINYLISRGYSVNKNSNEQLIQYTIENTTITHIYDASHVIKGVRNNMLTKNLTHFVSQDEPFSEEKKTASWTDVKDFYQIHQKSSSQLLTKITDEHISPNQLKMKTSLATQIFSKTFGTTMKSYSNNSNLQRELSGTADILMFFNEVFDSINGAGDPIQNSIKGSVSRSSSHLAYWQCTISAIEKMEWVIKEKDENERVNKKQQTKEGKKRRKQPQVGDVCRRSKVLHNIISTLKGLIFITEKLLNEGFEHFSPRRLNSDGLENYFGNAKSICLALKSPSPRQFKSSFSTLFFDNSLSLHSPGSNCEKDDDIPLLQSTTLLQVNESVVDVAHDNINCQKGNDDETSQLSPSISFEDEAISSTAGRICKKIKAKVKCGNCISTLESSNEDYAVADNEPMFKIPSCLLLSIVKNTVTKVEEILPTICFEKKLSHTIVGLIENDFIVGCDEHKKELTKTLCTTLVELLIHAYVRRVNAILKGKVNIVNEKDDLQKAALTFRRSKKHIGKYAPKTDD